MNEVNIDRLQIEIEAEAANASGELDKLAKSLESLKNSLNAISGIEKVSEELKDLTSALSGLSGIQVNIKKLSSDLNSLSKVRFPKMSGFAQNIRELASAASGVNLPTVTNLRAMASAIRDFANLPDIKLKLGNLKTKIIEISDAASVIDGAGVGRLNLLGSAVRGFSSLPASKFSLATFANGIGKLSEAVGKIPDDILRKLSDVYSAIKPFASMQPGKGMSSFTRSLNSIAKINAKDVAANLKKINDAIKSLAPSLTKIGHIMPALSRFPSLIKQLSGASAYMTRGGGSAGKSKGLLGGLIGNFTEFVKSAIVVQAVKKISQAVAGAIDNVNSYIEDMNLFVVAMKEFGNEGRIFAENLEANLGIDSGQVMKNMGLFQQLTTSFGIAGDKAYVLSKNLTQLAYDYSSLLNIPVEEMFLKLKSGIVGEIEPMRAIGKDLSVARLQLELTNLGINANVNNLTQADKAMLRYIALMKQSTNEMGDMARTLESPANMLRVLKAQLGLVSREIGSIFIPILTKVLPYIIAFVKVLREAVSALALIAGFKMPEFKAEDEAKGFIGIGDGLDSMADSASNARKEMKYLISGFDELNILQSNKSGSATGGAGGGTDILGDLSLPDYDMLEELTKNRVSNIVDLIKNKFNEIKDIWGPVFKPAGESLENLWGQMKRLGAFSWEGLKGFYNEFLKPVGNWILGRGFPEFVNVLSTELMYINWGGINASLKKLWKALSPFAVKVGEGLLWFWKNVLVPLGGWTVNKVVPLFLEGLAAAIRIIDGVLTAAQPALLWLWDKFLEPLGAWTGGIIIETLNWIVDGLNGVSDWVNNNTETVQAGLLGVAAALAVMAAPAVVSSIAGMAAKLAGVGGLIASLINPVTLVAAAIGVAIGLLVNLFNNDENFRSQVLQTWELIKEGVGNTVDKLKDIWDNTLEPIFVQIVEAVTNTFNTIKNIWETILRPVFENLFKNIADLWNEHLVPFLGKVGSLVATLISSALTIWNSVILPLINWVVDELGPPVTTVLNGIINVVTLLLATAVDVFGGLTEVFNGIITFLTGVFTGDWEKAWNGIKTIFAVFADGVKAIFKGAINGVIGIVNFFIDKLNKLSVKVPDNPITGNGFTLGFDIKHIKPLAKGAVIPPNNEFLALLGDQKSGINVEAPQSVIYDTVVDANGPLADVMLTVGRMIVKAIDEKDTDVKIDGETVGKKSVQHIDRMSRRNGYSPVNAG